MHRYRVCAALDLVVIPRDDMPMFNTLSSPAAYFASRRSGRPREMVAPGPDPQQLGDIVAMAIRTPDHGKLNPWRVVAVGPEQRGALGQALEQAYRADTPAAGKTEIQAMNEFAQMAPCLLVVLHSPVSGSKIPLWEQQLSTGAFCMNLLHAAHVHGFVGGWITGWPSYSERVRDLFGETHESIAGFLFIGTPSAPLQERPRPELDQILSHWRTESG